jgi:hypothetical protein
MADQLVFDGFAVLDHRVSLGRAGWQQIEEPLPYRARVTGTFSGYVATVIVAEKGGQTTRQHVVVVDEFAVQLVRRPDGAVDQVPGTDPADGDDGEGDAESEPVDDELAAQLDKVFA